MTEKFTLECPDELQMWRESLMEKSPRIANKLRTLMRIENKLLKKLYNQTYTSHEDPVEKQQLKKANTAPTKTLSEINKFTFEEDSNSAETNEKTIGSEEIEEEEEEHDSSIHNKTEKDLKYEVAYYQDEELGFDISYGNEGVYVSRINEKGKEKQISLYSTLYGINNQNVNSFDLDKMKKALSTLSRPARITFRKSIVQTPYGTANIINRSTVSGKIQIGLEYATAYIDEENISRFTYNKQWNEFEESRLVDLVTIYQSQMKQSRSGFRNRNNGSSGNSTSRPRTNMSRLSGGNGTGGIPWDDISDEMHHRSGKDCEKRWELINTLNHLLSEDVLYNKLSYYTRKGDVQSVKRIIQRCPALLLRPDKNRSTPLFTACWYGKYEIAKLMIEYGARVNHSNLKGNYPIHMAIENSFVNIVNLLIANDAKINLNFVYNLIDNKDNYNIDPEVVLSVNRAQLVSGDRVWYQHEKLGLIRAVIMEKLTDLRPVHYIIKMRINQYHEAAMNNGSAGNISKIMRVSILDKCLKPVTETNGPPLKELITKKQKMLERFNKWDSFWCEYNEEQIRVEKEILTKEKSKINLVNENKTEVAKGKIEIESTHKIEIEPDAEHALLPLLSEDEDEEADETENEYLTEIDEEDSSEEVQETKEQHHKNEQQQSEKENQPEQNSNSQKIDPKKPIDKDNKTSPTESNMNIKQREPFHPPVIHNNYYLTKLKNVPLANRCVGLRKLQTAISQHPDTKDHEYEQEQISVNNNDPSKKLCYVAREHVRRFDIVMEKMIDYTKEQQ